MTNDYLKKVSEFFEKKNKPIATPAIAPEIKPVTVEIKDVSPGALRELLEKNLKWSQIIYEQNRKINQKLFWSVIIGWSRFVIIMGIIIASVIFSFPIVRDIWQNYNKISNILANSSAQTNNSLDQLINLLPIEATKQEQLKELLKK